MKFITIPGKNGSLAFDASRINRMEESQNGTTTWLYLGTPDGTEVWTVTLSLPEAVALINAQLSDEEEV